ncbi:HAMP domain-containing protein [Litoribacillus peritrichatus]|uniref:histidine kinase n=1 Tax=Litoribacillus peritrichatus TaxID=718191 RepID=A0ABP7NAJ8_9GAMM
MATSSIESVVDVLPPKVLLGALRQLKQGNFSTRLPEDLEGVDGQIANLFNEVADIAGTLVADVNSVSKSVGQKGKTKQRLSKAGLKGGWADYVDSVNSMVGGLTQHSAEMARVVAAVSKGDLTQTIDLSGEDQPLSGDFLRYGKMVNGMVEQLSVFGSEVTRVAREVGVEGKLGAQAQVKGVSGAWKELTDNVNLMADNLTNQVRDIAQVTTAVANGDLTKTITVEVKGEILALKNTINTMVDQLGSFADEVTRVAREVGTEGVLGGQAQVKGVAGTWRELTENVNSMANNLTSQVRNIATVTTAVANGDLTKKITVDAKGEILTLKDTINTMVDQLGSFGDEVTRVAREVGTEGVLGGQAKVQGVAGVWKELTDNVNSMANNLTGQVRNIAEVATAIAEGDLGKKITVDAQGEILTLKNTINTMLDKLLSFSSEVTRLARQVGTEGALGVEAQVNDVSGVWKELTDNVNLMASNLTEQLRDVSKVATAIRDGDLSQKITVDVRGEILQIKEVINSTVDQLNIFATEVTSLAGQVGTEGRLGVQAEVPGVAGIWKALTDNVNLMTANLTEQLRDVSKVATAIRDGDLSQKITADAQGEILQMKQAINSKVDLLSMFTNELRVLASQVGTQGQLGVQAEAPGFSGIWKELTDNVNLMASNLTEQLRDVSKVATAIRDGDLSQKITVEVRGEILQIKEVINSTVDQLNVFATETTKLAGLVGTEGRLGVQAEVPGVAGIWKDLTDNVNLMASNLTEQLRDVSKVATAIRDGDLSQKITVEVLGEILQIKEVINSTVDQLNLFATEVTTLAGKVGTEGRLGVQAEVPGVAGIWKDLTDNVNLMTSNLTEQLRDVSKVATAIRDGDLSQIITVDVQGEILQIKEVINSTVDQLNVFATETTKLAGLVGTEGRLGVQAEVPGVAGIWKELTDNVNLMASNLTEQLRDVSKVATAIRDGKLGQKITVQVQGEILQIKEVINSTVDQLNVFATETTKLASLVGTEGRLGVQAEVPGVAGIWKDLTDNVNLMASNLTEQLRDVSKVATAIRDGKLGQKITVEVRGEILQIKEVINSTVDQLADFASEVTRLAQQVGTEGQLGVKANVPGAAGVWKDLTDNVNLMASNLTEQLRDVSKIATAIAQGDLSQKITVDVKGEILEIKKVINDMIDTLDTFADQVVTVAREVGVEGRLGAQADVPGAAGTWRDLTDNVNELAGNLTNQVRAIGEVATAVTDGDLSRTISVEAQGEVALLKDNINQMIDTLAETTRVNQEQDWLKTNLAKFTRMLQGQRDLFSVTSQVLSELAPVVDIQHGVFYMVEKDGDKAYLKLYAAYAYKERKGLSNQFEFGEGLVGQCAMEKQRILLTHVPSDYVQINSGLGEAPPLNIVVVPIVYEGEVKGVVELASFASFNDVRLAFLEQLYESMGIVVATIEASMRTDELLRQSQGLTEELQNQQEELQQTNEELEEKARQLSEQKTEVERKNTEVEEARTALEEKAEQLALSSKYKSEFLANMSHELRTPLNSLLILSQQLTENLESNLNEKQVKAAKTIYESGSDLLSLINEVLDLAKVESGTLTVNVNRTTFLDIAGFAHRSFDQVADGKLLNFDVELAEDLTEEIETDIKRLQQILRNLLGNAFKFTEHGGVKLIIEPATRGWTIGHPVLSQASAVVAMKVSDTGIGIPKNRQLLIFEAFQQADGSTSRKYGGTGLGLSISRELARLLGGEIRVESIEDEGCTFTLYLPLRFQYQTQVSRKDNKQSYLQAEHYLKAPPSSSLPVESMASSGLKTVQTSSLLDDRGSLVEGDRSLLVIEDDEAFAELLMNHARSQGFKVMVALTGSEGLELASEYQPDAITLDLHLPDMQGRVVLDRLKHDLNTRHIPVHVLSVDDAESRCIAQGAINFLQKPLDINGLEQAMANISQYLEKQVKHLLVVEDDSTQRNSIVDLISGPDVEIMAVDSAEAALSALKAQSFDCVVLDLMLPDMDGIDLLHKMKADIGVKPLPIIVYTGCELTPEEETNLKQLAESIIVKDARSPERLLDETALFLHRMESQLPEKKQKMIRQVYQSDPALAGSKVLVVDDDVRNIFAVTSLLEQHNLTVLRAENGKEAIETLKQNPDVDAVLIDIMMPEMDGYEAMRRIRQQAKFKRLPLIALTAKAMMGDREKCIVAGASDYITKPINSEQLLSLLRVWIAK